MGEFDKFIKIELKQAGVRTSKLPKRKRIKLFHKLFPDKIGIYATLFH
jgi:hypothetical protein